MDQSSAYFLDQSSGPVTFRSAGVECPDTSRFLAAAVPATENRVAGSVAEARSR